MRAFFAEQRPQVVVVAAAKVGGIKANNDFPVEVLQIENLAIQNNLIEAANDYGAEKFALSRQLLHLAEIRPANRSRRAPCSPGPWKPTNEPYALAKIAGITLCQSYRREYGRNFISAQADRHLRTGG